MMKKLKGEKGIARVDEALSKALMAIEGALQEWAKQPLPFTSVDELVVLRNQLLKMRRSLKGEIKAESIGMWRMMDGWPLGEHIRRLVADAEYEYDRLVI